MTGEGGWIAARPSIAGALGAMCIATSAIFVRLAHVSPSTAAVFRCLYALPALGLLAALERRRFGPREGRQRVLAMAAGVFFAADLVLWHNSIRFIGAGLATVLGNVQVVLVGLAAWLFMGERAKTRVVLAIPLMLVGVVLISGVLERGSYGANPPLGVLFGVATAFVYTGFLLTLRAGNRDVRRPAGPLFDATATATVFAALAGVALGELEIAPVWPAHGWLLLLALTSQVVGWLLISVSLPRLPALTTSIVLTLQPAGSVLLAIVLLGEQPTLLQLLGVLTILTGLITANVIRRRPEPAAAG